MGITEREKAIAVLQKERKTALHDNVWAFDYAISSLKTDLKYDLMHEGEEIYTKADMVVMLEDLLMEIKHTVTMEEDASSNEDLVKRNNVMKVVQFRIDKLKENKNDRN